MNERLKLNEPVRRMERNTRTILTGSIVLPEPPQGSRETSAVLLPGCDGKSFSISQEMLSRGILALGSTGSGKTNFILNILNSVLKNLGQEEIAVIFDAKGDFTSQFYRRDDPHHVLISAEENSQETGGQTWNLFWELFPEGKLPQMNGGLQSDILELSAALFAPLENQQQPFFHLAARDVFRMVVHSFLERAARTSTAEKLCNRAFIDFLDCCSTKELLALAGPDFAYLRSYLGSPECPTPQSLGVEGTLHAMTASQFVGPFRSGTGERDFSIRRLVREKGGKVVFVAYDLSRGEALGPLLSVLFDLAVKEQLSSGKGNLYLFLDELSVLPYVHRLSYACNLGRSRGIKTIVGLQSIEMLREPYGEALSKSILAGFVNAVCFKAVDAATRDYISGRFGRTLEVLPCGGTYISHEGYVVGDQELWSLRPGEAFFDFFGYPPFRMWVQRFQ